MRPLYIVPRTVEITVDSSATVTDTYTYIYFSLLDRRSSYQRSENPVKLVRDFDELKEYITVTRIGR